MNQKERLEALSEAVVPEAIEWVKELRAYRVYQGKDPDYFKKARIGIGIVGGAIRLCATAENARSNDIIQARIDAGLTEVAEPKLLESGVRG